MSEEKKLPHIEPAEINTDDLMAKYDKESDRKSTRLNSSHIH